MFRKLLALVVLLTVASTCHAQVIETVGEMTAALELYQPEHTAALAVGRGFKAAPLRILGSTSATYLTTVGELREALALYQAARPVRMAIGNDSHFVSLELTVQVMSPDLRAGWWDNYADALCTTCTPVALVHEHVPSGPPDVTPAPVIIGESTRTDGAQ
jgi:hypothetical protein